VGQTLTATIRQLTLHSKKFGCHGGATVAHLGATWCHLAPVNANTLHVGACWCLGMRKVPHVISRCNKNGFRGDVSECFLCA